MAAATGIILSAIYMLSLVQRVFWNPVTREENRRLPEIRPSEAIGALALVVVMVWIGVRPNDFLDRIRPSVEQVRRAVTTRKSAETRRFLGPSGLGMTERSFRP